MEASIGTIDFSATSKLIILSLIVVGVYWLTVSWSPRRASPDRFETSRGTAIECLAWEAPKNSLKNNRCFVVDASASGIISRCSLSGGLILDQECEYEPGVWWPVVVVDERLQTDFMAYSQSIPKKKTLAPEVPCQCDSVPSKDFSVFTSDTDREKQVPIWIINSISASMISCFIIRHI